MMELPCDCRMHSSSAAQVMGFSDVQPKRAVWQRHFSGIHFDAESAGWRFLSCLCALPSVPLGGGWATEM